MILKNNINSATIFYGELQMAHLLVKHKVEDYNKWKVAFDDHAAYRSENGSLGGKIFRNANDPDELFKK